MAQPPTAQPAIAQPAIAQPETPRPPRRLTLADLRWNEDDRDYCDAVACLRMYWSQAVHMDPERQEQMRQHIIRGHFKHTKSSWKQASSHRLYKKAMKKDSANTWPVFLILYAMYNVLPDVYLERVRSAGHTTALVDASNSYFAAHPGTVRPLQYDTNTTKGNRWRQKWRKLRNTPTTFRVKGTTTNAAAAMGANSANSTAQRAPAPASIFQRTSTTTSTLSSAPATGTSPFSSVPATGTSLFPNVAATGSIFQRSPVTSNPFQSTPTSVASSQQTTAATGNTSFQRPPVPNVAAPVAVETPARNAVAQSTSVQRSPVPNVAAPVAVETPARNAVAQSTSIQRSPVPNVAAPVAVEAPAPNTVAQSTAVVRQYAPVDMGFAPNPPTPAPKTSSAPSAAPSSTQTQRDAPVAINPFQQSTPSRNATAASTQAASKNTAASKSTAVPTSKEVVTVDDDTTSNNSDQSSLADFDEVTRNRLLDNDSLANFTEPPPTESTSTSSRENRPQRAEFLARAAGLSDTNSLHVKRLRELKDIPEEQSPSKKSKIGRILDNMLSPTENFGAQQGEMTNTVAQPTMQEMARDIAAMKKDILSMKREMTDIVVTISSVVASLREEIEKLKKKSG